MFENSRWFFILLIAGIVGVGYTAHYFSSVDDANATLQEARSKLASLHEMGAQRQRASSEMQRSVSLNHEQREKNAVLLKAKEVLDARVRKIESELKTMTVFMKVAVERARNDAPGKEVGDLTLANGKTLRAVKIRKFDGSSISLVHADGIGSIPFDQLPASMLEKYDFGPAPLLASLTAAEQTFADSADPKAAEARKKKELAIASIAKPSQQPVKAAPTIDDAKVRDIKLKIASLETRIKAAQSSASAYQQQSSENYTNGDIAKGRGTPAAKYWTAAQQAAQQAQAYKTQAASLEGEKKKLEIELEFANKPK